MLIDSLQEPAAPHWYNKLRSGYLEENHFTQENCGEWARVCVCVYTDTFSCSLGDSAPRWEVISPSFPGRTQSVHCRNLKNQRKKCSIPSLCFKLSSLSVRVEFFMTGFTAKIAVIHLHSHMQTFPYTPLSPFASHSKCKWGWSLETGSTRGKIGLSFKGSAADALKFTNYTPHPRQRWLLEAKRKKLRKEEDRDLRMSQRDNGGEG